MSSSSLKHQTIAGYISEYATARHMSILRAVQSEMCREFIKVRLNRDKSQLSEQEEGSEICSD